MWRICALTSLRQAGGNTGRRILKPFARTAMASRGKLENRGRKTSAPSAAARSAEFTFVNIIFPSLTQCFSCLFVGGIHSLHDLAMPSLREPPPSWRRMLPAVWRWVMMGWRDDRKAPPEDVNHLWIAWRNMVSCFILYTLKEITRNVSDFPVIFYSTNEPNNGRKKNEKSSTIPIKVDAMKWIF